MSFQHYLKLDRTKEFIEQDIVMLVNTINIPAKVSRYTVNGETLVNIQTLSEYTIPVTTSLAQIPISITGDITGMTPTLRRRAIIFMREITGGINNVRMCSWEIDTPLSSCAIDRENLATFGASTTWVLPVTRISYIV